MVGDQVTLRTSPFVAHQQLSEASLFCLYIISGLTCIVEERRKESLMRNLYTRLTFSDMIFLRCSIVVLKTLSGFAYFREIQASTLWHNCQNCNLQPDCILNHSNERTKINLNKHNEDN